MSRAPAPARTAPTAPEPSGTLVRAFPRGRPGAEEELRISTDEYNGHEYISIRVWYRGHDGHWRPTPKGCTIRRAEIPDALAALAEAAASLGVEAGQGASAAAEADGPRATGRHFDEFEGEGVGRQGPR